MIFTGEATPDRDRVIYQGPAVLDAVALGVIVGVLDAVALGVMVGVLDAVAVDVTVGVSLAVGLGPSVGVSLGVSVGASSVVIVRLTSSTKYLPETSPYMKNT